MTSHSQFGLGNPPLHPAFVNLGSDYDFIILVRANTNPTHGATNTCPTHATSTTLEIKRKRSSMFMFVIEAYDKNNKVIVDAMD
jgi:hypothetical protein